MHKLSLVLAFFFALVTGAPADPAKHPDTSGDDWTPLLNGKDLTGWQSAAGQPYKGKISSKPNNQGWIVKDGELVHGKKGGNIWTTERYGDFVLDLEVNTSGNSGLLFRCDNPRSYVQTGIEMQIERAGGPGKRHGFGAVYDCQAPSKPVGQKGWNRVTLTCRDNQITIMINGELVNEMDLNKWTTARKNPDGSKNKFKKPLKDFKREGHIGFQDHGKAVSYRNVKIKKLKRDTSRK